MIFVDDREGSAALAPLLRARGLPVTVCRMEFGDVSFIGNGPDGMPVSVGVEVKQIRDVISCMCDGRFTGHQLPGLIKEYIQPWLLIEGEWRPSTSPGKQGILEVRRSSGQWYEVNHGTRRFMYRDLVTWLLTVQIKAGVRVASCSNWGQATAWISTIYNWWTAKEYDEHRGHLQLHDPASDLLFDRALLVRPSLARLVAAQLPGIGRDKSQAVALHFGSVERLATADVSEFEAIPGIGRKMAERIYNALRSDA